MKNLVVAIHDKRPEFLELQKFSVESHVAGEFDYIIFNNASDASIRQKINEESKRLNIEVIELHEDYGRDGSHRLSDAMQSVWTHLQKRKGKVFWIDGDMFFIDSLDIESMSQKCDFAYMPIFRKQNSIECMWTGALFFDLDKVEADIDFSIQPIEGVQTDTAGSTYHYLKRHPDYRRIYFKNNMIYDFDEQHLKVQLNGCTGFIEFENGKPLKPYCDKRFFPYEKESDQYLLEFYREFEKHKSIVVENQFPKPYNFDLLKIDGDNPYFLFHFKSGSWAEYYNNEAHFKEKIKALEKLLKIWEKNGQKTHSTAN